MVRIKKDENEEAEDSGLKFAQEELSSNPKPGMAPHTHNPVLWFQRDGQVSRAEVAGPRFSGCSYNQDRESRGRYLHSPQESIPAHMCAQTCTPHTYIDTHT